MTKTNRAVLLTNASILDVREGKILHNKHLLIENGTIKEFYDNFPEIDKAEIIDILGKIVLPGLIDAHVHVNAITVNLGSLRVLPPSYVTP